MTHDLLFHYLFIICSFLSLINIEVNGRTVVRIKLVFLIDSILWLLLNQFSKKTWGLGRIFYKLKHDTNRILFKLWKRFGSNSWKLNSCSSCTSSRQHSLASGKSIFKKYMRSGKDFLKATIWDQPRLSSLFCLEVIVNWRNFAHFGTATLLQPKAV